MTNVNKTVLYTGVTNDLSRRLQEHREGLDGSFTTRYGAWHLLYYEVFTYIEDAIVREKEIKGWRREKKMKLIESKNPYYRFLNEDDEIY